MKKVTLNQKRIPKKEAIELALRDGILHSDYSDFLTERFENGDSIVNEVYELPESRILYITEVNQKRGGQGDIFPKEYFDKFVLNLMRIKNDKLNGRNSNITHWLFYSKNKSELINKIDDLKNELIEILKADIEFLNGSTKSLDYLSEKVKDYGNEKAMNEIYDNIVVYLGEVILKNSKGAEKWEINKIFNIPIISTKNDSIYFMPINIAWEELTNFEKIDFRKAYGKEARKIGEKLSYM
ncbi:hypothetical protein ABGT15_13145 [Flavobacterium enshiense]|uniref:hypothetical protein n=1 Tax=Flavobacterium enshiense TaxID=1341165 RepID=UPI00345D4AEA